MQKTMSLSLLKFSVPPKANPFSFLQMMTTSGTGILVYFLTLLLDKLKNTIMVKML
jgi:hypothetical protein